MIPIFSTQDLNKLSQFKLFNRGTTHVTPITVPNDTYLWSVAIGIAVLLILIFVFRNSLNQWKEATKSNIRSYIHKHILNVEGDTVKDNAFTSFVLGIDEMFLEPDKHGPDVVYDYLMEDFQPNAQDDEDDDEEDDDNEEDDEEEDDDDEEDEDEDEEDEEEEDEEDDDDEEEEDDDEEKDQDKVGDDEEKDQDQDDEDNE